MIFIDIIIPYFPLDCNEKRGKQIEKTDILCDLLERGERWERRNGLDNTFEI